MLLNYVLLIKHSMNAGYRREYMQRRNEDEELVDHEHSQQEWVVTMQKLPGSQGWCPQWAHLTKKHQWS